MTTCRERDFAGYAAATQIKLSAIIITDDLQRGHVLGSPSHGPQEAGQSTQGKKELQQSRTPGDIAVTAPLVTGLNSASLLGFRRIVVEGRSLL